MDKENNAKPSPVGEAQFQNKYLCTQRRQGDEKRTIQSDIQIINNCSYHPSWPLTTVYSKNFDTRCTV